MNGERRQPALVEWLSSVITLEPGEVLSTGTPAGRRTFMDPPGDVVTITASGIGELTDPVVLGPARTLTA